VDGTVQEISYPPPYYNQLQNRQRRILLVNWFKSFYQFTNIKVTQNQQFKKRLAKQKADVESVVFVVFFHFVTIQKTIWNGY